MQNKLPLSQLFPVLFLYLVISMVGLYYHEIWLDEAQHFLIGRDSNSLPALYDNMRYDGHPRLWNFLLYFITHYITENYAGMQVFHLLISTATVFIFLRYAPFSLLIKIMIISGYYFLFEYNLLSRNYALGIFFLFIGCIWLQNPGKYLLRIGVILLLLCNTHFFFSFAATGIFLYVLIDYYSQRKLFNFRFGIFSLLFLCGLISILVQMKTPPDDSCNPATPEKWHTLKSLSFAGATLAKGWLPIPKISNERFWNTFWVDTIGATGRNMLSLFFLVYPVILLGKEKKALVFYYSSVVLLLAFFAVAQLGGARHFGMIYIFFLAACWMAGYHSTNVFSFQHLPGSRTGIIFFQAILYLVLSVQVMISVYALSQDLRRPFSQARNTVNYIIMRQLSQQKIAVDGYNSGPALSAYLGKKVFYLDINREGSYCCWKKAYFPTPRKTVAQEMSQSAFLQALDKFILISNRPMSCDKTQRTDNGFQYIPLDSFQNSIIFSENYYIYQVTRKINNQL